MREGEASGRLADRDRLRTPQVLIQRKRVDDDAGVQEVLRVEEPLDLLERGDRLIRVLQLQQLRAGATVAVLARGRSPVAGDQATCVHEEAAEDLRAIGLIEGEIGAHVDAAVTEVPVRHAGDPVGLHEVVLLAQVVAQDLGRDGGVLPAGPGRIARGGAAGQPAGVGADAPQGGGLLACGDDAVGVGAGVVRDRLGVGHGLRRRGPTHLDQQPAGSCRQLRNGARALGRADHVHEA